MIFVCFFFTKKTVKKNETDIITADKKSKFRMCIKQFIITPDTKATFENASHKYI